MYINNGYNAKSKKVLAPWKHHLSQIKNIEVRDFSTFIRVYNVHLFTVHLFDVNCYIDDSRSIACASIATVDSVFKKKAEAIIAQVEAAILAEGDNPPKPWKFTADPTIVSHPGGINITLDSEFFNNMRALLNWYDARKS